ncbi:HEAT repeat domain-containing protein [Kitasatospora sp. NPDC058170]|uniref:HEAT repeat domain-containing protein n=1 Tax=Kitasatospora sp. NPDC058170 TaxID=3346364 RepID=UPI0036DE14BD
MGTGEQNTGIEASGSAEGSGRSKMSARVEASGSRAVALGGSATTVVTGNGNLVIEKAYLGAAPERSRESDAAAVDAYRQRVRESYARLDLEVLTPLSEQGEHPVVELREVFVAPRVRADPPPVELPRELLQRLLATGEVLADRDLPPGVTPETVQHLRDTHRRRPAEAVLDVLAGPRGARAVLLGDPGAGKSTLARYLALSLSLPGCATGSLAALAGRLPLVVELRQYAEAQWRERTFEDFLDHLHATKGMSVPAPVLRHLLRTGAAVVVFDGLDELFDPRIRTEAAQRIAAFAARWDQARVVVTSRVIGYQRGVLDGAGFAHYMLEDLDEEQIRTFARSWYRVACPTDPEQAEQLVRRVTDAVAASRPVRELAGNPLLLTILAIIGRRQTLPRDRQGVYEHAVKVLVAHWDRDIKHLKADLPPAVDEALEMLEPKERLELLRLLARRMQEGHGGIAGNHIHADELEEVVRDYLLQFGHAEKDARMAARAMREQLRTRNFILARYGGEVYGFVHRAFLEYLAAADIAHRYKEEREWTPEELIEEVVAARVGDPAWHEVLLLLVGQLSERDAARVIDRLLAIHAAEARDPDVLVLAIRALAEVRKIGLLGVQSDAVVDAMIALPSGSSGPLLADAQLALSSFGSAWSGRRRYLRWFHLLGWSRSGTAAVEISCMMHSSYAALRALATHHDNETVRSAALGSLGRHFAENADTFRLLQERVVQDPAPEVRSAVLRVLGRGGWRGRAGAMQVVMERAVEDPAAGPRSVALSALRGWKVCDNVLRFMRERAVEDVAPGPRAAVLEVLGSGQWEGREDVSAFLRERAVSDPAPGPRVAALTALRGWSGQEEVVRFLLARAVDDSAPGVRTAALAALYERRERQDVVAFVMERARHDPDPAARSRILRRWVTSADLVDTVIDSARRDAAAEVRFDAVLALHQLSYRDDVAALLRDIATNQSDPLIRDAAVFGFYNRARRADGDALAFLLARAVEDPAPEPRIAALHVLGEFPQGPAREEVLALISTRAVEDVSGEVRSAALDVLRASAEREEVVRVLVQCAVGDPEPEARYAAILAFTEYRSGARDDVVAVLLDRARHDPDPANRLAAFQRWAHLAAGDDGAEIRLWATSSPDPEVRADAVRMLAWQWPGDQAAVATLRGLAGQDEHPDVRAAAARALVVVDALTQE